MKFFHLADLHIGKNVNGFSMLEDQRDVLEQVLREVEQDPPEAILLAGDIYDRPIPSVGAVALFDWFLTELAERSVPCLVVAGNHDSGVRLGFGGELLQKNGIFLAGVATEQLLHIPFQREGVHAEVWLLPFLRPAEAAALFPEEEIKSYDDGIRVLLTHQKSRSDVCNLLLAHQFVTQEGKEPERSDSETVTVGGVEKVGCTAFAEFDYVALGHLHGPQKVGENCRYAGSPLPYSFSEVRQKKGITVVEVAQNKEITVSQIPLQPRHPMREIRGPLNDLIRPEIAAQGNVEDYLHVTLTDELEPENANARLREVYPNLMKLDFDNHRTRQESFLCGGDESQSLSIKELFDAFYEQQNGRELDALARGMVEDVLKALGGEL